jgi:hypothetical protein
MMVNIFIFFQEKGNSIMPKYSGKDSSGFIAKLMHIFLASMCLRQNLLICGGSDGRIPYDVYSMLIDPLHQLNVYIMAGMGQLLMLRLVNGRNLNPNLRVSHVLMMRLMRIISSRISAISNLLVYPRQISTNGQMLVLERFVRIVSSCFHAKLGILGVICDRDNEIRIFKLKTNGHINCFFRYTLR